MFEKIDNLVFSTDDIELDDIASNMDTWFSDGIRLNTVELNNINLNGDNFDEDYPANSFLV